MNVSALTQTDHYIPDPRNPGPGYGAHLVSVARSMLTLATLFALVAVSTLLSQAAPAAAGGPIRCRTVSYPVALAEHGPADQRIAGTLCTPSGRPPRTVQILLPGGSYDRSYWEWPGEQRGPSYVDIMTHAGYATLAVDRIGTGASSSPHSSQYAPRTHELTIVQVIRQLRYDRVVLVGNSIGSSIARTVAARHPTLVDGLILTGESSNPDWAAFERLGADFRPASEHPLLAHRHLDEGYTAPKIGTKTTWFYHRPTASPSVMLRDESNPEPDVYPTDPHFGSIALNQLITVPVLVIVGQYDKLLCGVTDCTSSAALLAQERAAYPVGTNLDALVVPDTGHVLNLHRTAADWYAQTRTWTDRHIGV